MSKSRVFEDYTITSQLMEESGTFYLQFYNTLLHKKYEANVAYDTLGLPGKPAQVFNVLNYCLDKKEGYTFGFALNGSILGVMFDALIGGVLSVSFSITLEEISVSDDTVVSYKLKNLETELKEVKEELEETKEELKETKEELSTMTSRVERMDQIIDNLMDSVEIWLINRYKSLPHLPNTKSSFLNIPFSLGITELDLSRIEACADQILELNMIDWNKLRLFPNLKKLTAHAYNCDDHCKCTRPTCYFGSIIQPCAGFKTVARSNSLEQLVLYRAESASRDYSLTHFGWLPRFPKLKSIDTKTVYPLTNIVEYLPECPKLKYIRIHTASPALVRYCIENGIKLE
jgi:hypothetical protein